MSKLKKIFLTPLGKRGFIGDVKKARGMALFLVMISLALMTSVVGDLSYNETIRYKMALHERDAFKAEALAEGGINLARLFLIIQSKIQPYISTFAGFGVPLPAYTIWELLPLEGEMLKGLTTGDLAGSLGLDVSEALEKRREERALKEQQQKDEGESSFSPPDGGFGAFEGSFNISIQDEESKISLRSWSTVTDAKKREATRKILASLFSPRRYDELFDGRNATGARVDRPSLIANIFDYMDIDEQRLDPYAVGPSWGTSGGGSEKDVYGAERVIPKNAYFDSFEELRLVHGMTDGHMRAFSDALTLYGEDGKINILSAKDQVVEAIISFCAANELDPLLQNPIWVEETVKNWRDYQTQGMGPVSVQGFVNFLQTRGITVDAPNCQTILDVKSANFTLKSTATVNDVTRTLTLVTRVVNNAEELYYFRNN